jgi:hypothetical protein
VGEWNKSRLVVYGPHVQHWLNGKVIVQYDLGSPELQGADRPVQVQGHAQFAQAATGHISLQDHRQHRLVPQHPP